MLGAGRKSETRQPKGGQMSSAIAGRLQEAAGGGYWLFVGLFHMSETPKAMRKLLTPNFSNAPFNSLFINKKPRKQWACGGGIKMSGEWDSNPRPSGPKPDALPDCAIARIKIKRVGRICPMSNLNGAAAGRFLQNWRMGIPPRVECVQKKASVFAGRPFLSF